MRHVITKADKLLIASILIFATVWLVFWNFVVFSGQNATEVIIEVNGQHFASYNLSSITEPKTVEVTTEFGTNILEITHYSVRVIYADCPDKLDIQAGAITRPGNIIVCLPNRLVVRLGSHRTVDGVTF